jgi:putative glutamine amidotransferase
MARRARGPQAAVIARPRPHTAPPLIGVVTHELRADAERVWAPAPGRSLRDLAPQRLALRLTYTQAVQEAGGIAVVVPAHGYVDDTAALLDRLDGLLFSGGPDLDPAVYGQARHPRLGPDVDRVSDEYELALLAGAAERDLPVLGICRGMQALNVSRGGTLHQHLPDRSAARVAAPALALAA